MTKVKFKLFTLSLKKEETNVDGSATSYEVNQFLNSGVQPFDVSCEYNEISKSLLVSVGYYEEKSIFKTIFDWLRRRGEYQIRFAKLCHYDEKGHGLYVQLDLENAINYNEHIVISHGIYVEDSIAHVAFIEHKIPVEFETVIDPNHEKENE